MSIGNRRLLLIVGFPALIALLVIAINASLPGSPISKENAGRIGRGKTLAEVAVILGSPGRPWIDNSGRDFAHLAGLESAEVGAVRWWEEDGRTYVVFFDHNERSLGAHFGDRPRGWFFADLRRRLGL